MYLVRKSLRFILFLCFPALLVLSATLENAYAEHRISYSKSKKLDITRRRKAANNKLKAKKQNYSTSVGVHRGLHVSNFPKPDTKS